MKYSYLRGLSDEALKNIHQHNVYWQLKWWNLYEENYKNNVKDNFTSEQLERFTKNVSKIEKVMKERGLI